MKQGNRPEKLILLIGDKNLSSWSMRAWLVAKQSDLIFQEKLIRLDTAETKSEIARHSPSGKVPCLIHGNLRIWDSLAICEYLAEIAPNRLLWPVNRQSRALARSFVAEMHSGFAAIRNQLSMDIQLKIKIKHLETTTLKDIERIFYLLKFALKQSKGPFLFGEFGIVDAFSAPVVFRFKSYGIETNSVAVNSYMNQIVKQKHVKNWIKSARQEKPKTYLFKETK